MAKLQKTTYTYVVVHDENDRPTDIGHAISAAAYGDMVGQETDEKIESLTDEQAAELLIALGSEPGFFGLDDEDNDEL